MDDGSIGRPAAIIQVGVLARMLSEALQSCDPALASEAFVVELHELAEQSHGLVEADATERAARE